MAAILQVLLAIGTGIAIMVAEWHPAYLVGFAAGQLFHGIFVGAEEGAHFWNGSVAFDELVEKAVTITVRTRLKNSSGLIFDKNQIESE